MIFVFICLAGLMVGRRIGWALSKAILYPAGSNVLVAVTCLAWGLLVAFGVSELILWQQPHWALKYFLGYGVGGYIAYPNFDLVNESSIPQHAMFRHNLIETIPILTYIAASILFALVL